VWLHILVEDPRHKYQDLSFDVVVTVEEVRVSLLSEVQR